MTNHSSIEARECRWCANSIGASARVCPHCYRGQGVWILITAMPTWVTAVIAIAAATVAVLQVQAAKEAVAAARTVSKTTTAAVPAPIVVETSGVSMDDVTRLLADMQVEMQAVAQQRHDARLEAIDGRIKQAAKSVAAATRTADDALAKTKATRKLFDALQEDIDKYRDSDAIRDIGSRIEHVVERYVDALAECQGASETCAASRGSTVSLYRSLSSAVESYRGQVTDISHGIMVRDTCDQGRRMLDWSASGSDFGWYRDNCT